jgi:hypothetical protein
MQPEMKLALIATAIFLVVGMSATYTATNGIVGSLVGQSGADYGVGNSLDNRGFLMHALIFYLAMYFILKKMK